MIFPSANCKMIFVVSVLITGDILCLKNKVYFMIRQIIYIFRLMFQGQRTLIPVLPICVTSALMSRYLNIYGISRRYI